MATDALFDDVVLLLHCDGSDGGTTFTDVIGHTVTAGGNAHTETDQKKFGTASLQLDGTGDYLSVADSADWNFGSGDFCIELWGYSVTKGGSEPGIIIGQIDSFGSNSNGWGFYATGTGLGFFATASGSYGDKIAISNAYTTVASWGHLCVERYGSSVKVYSGGTSIFSGTISGSMPDVSYALRIGDGTSGTNPASGYYDDIRITKAARYKGNFTPPTEAFPDSGAITSSGALSAQVATLSGTGTWTGATIGALAAQAAALSGAGTVARDSSGALSAQGATIAGTGVLGPAGSGALTAQSATIAGTAVSLNGYEATETVVVTEPALDTIYGISAAILCNAQITTSATLTEALTWGTEENASLSDAVATLLSLPLPVTEAANMAEVLTAVAALLVTETVTLTETFPEGTQITWDAVESFLATSSLDVRQTFVDALTASLAAQSLAIFATLDSVTETTTLGEVLAEAAAYVHAVVEALAMSETGSAVLNLIFAVDEETTLSEALAAGLHFSDSLVAGLAFVGTLSTDADSTATWVVHPEIPAATTYNNFDFNSFAGVGDTFLGAMTDGIYELTGEDDAGTDIASVVRTGLLELGSSLLKQVTRAYLGYTSDGRLILKTVTTDGGDKTERWYELEETANAVREARIKLGKGVKARYWQFELINADGADFHVDQLQLLPMALSRRVKE